MTCTFRTPISRLNTEFQISLYVHKGGWSLKLMLQGINRSIPHSPPWLHVVLRGVKHVCPSYIIFFTIPRLSFFSHVRIFSLSISSYWTCICVNIRIECLLKLYLPVYLWSFRDGLSGEVLLTSGVFILLWHNDGWITSQNISNSYVRCVCCMTDPSLHDTPLHSLLRDVWQSSNWLYSTTLLYLF